MRRSLVLMLVSHVPLPLGHPTLCKSGNHPPWPPRALFTGPYGGRFGGGYAHNSPLASSGAAATVAGVADMAANDASLDFS